LYKRSESFLAESLQRSPALTSKRSIRGWDTWLSLAMPSLSLVTDRAKISILFKGTEISSGCGMGRDLTLGSDNPRTQSTVSYIEISFSR